MLAARGAGYSWGLAEEAGKAARWLAARRLPWLLSLIDLLAAPPGSKAPIWSTEESVRPSEATASICPILAGSHIVDSFTTQRGFYVHLSRMRQPLLLLPFLSRLANATRQPVVVTWKETRIWLLSTTAQCRMQDLEALVVDTVDEVTVTSDETGDVSGQTFGPIAGGCPVSPRNWAALEAIAARTYVPASELSRLQGAGAGLQDTD